MLIPFFVSSEVVKWDIKTLKVLDRVPTYYSVGFNDSGGDSKTIWKIFGMLITKLLKIDFYRSRVNTMAQIFGRY